MSPVNAALWLLVALFALVILLAVFLVGWFIVDTIRGKS